MPLRRTLGRRRCRSALLVLALMASAMAEGYSLDALLRLPLERLLELRVSSTQTSPVQPRYRHGR